MHYFSSTFSSPSRRPSALADEASAWSGSAPDAEFETLFRAHRDELQGFLFRKLRSYEDAEDALMLTFYKAWRARAGFRGEAAGKTWLYRIAAHVALDMVRCRRRRPAEQGLDDGPAEWEGKMADRVSDPAEDVLETERLAETQQALAEAIRRLTPEQRRLLSLYYFDGQKFETISSQLGIPYTKVRGRLNRIRQLIRRDLVDRQRVELTVSAEA
jgi:RNA polymerase sigma-70 factor (ECF subfamily)